MTARKTIEAATYVIDSGKVIKAPIEKWEDYSYFFQGFWEDVAVFQYYYSPKGLLIFNIKSGAVTEIPGTASFVLPKILEDNAHFSVLYGPKNDEYIFQFDKVTLALVKKIYVRSLYERRYVVSHYWSSVKKPVIEEKIDERTVHYLAGNDRQVEIIYGHEVDLREWWNFSVYYDSNQNRYAITVKFDDGK
jgi:hypothetical protein